MFTRPERLRQPLTLVALASAFWIALETALAIAPLSLAVGPVVVLTILWALQSSAEKASAPLWQVALMGGAILAYARRIGVVALERLEAIPDWDFKAFWIPARVAVRGGNFYRPQELLAASDLPVGNEFRREILEVGFLYPPPTMWLFAPFGLVEHFQVALASWYVVNALVCAGCIWLLYRCCLGDRSAAIGVPLAATLILVFAAAPQTFAYGQTNFILLLALLTFWLARTSRRSGAPLAAAAVVKPIGGLVVLFEACIHRRWSALSQSAWILLLAIVASCLFFGLDTVIEYVVSNPVPRLPRYVFSEPINQSLLATSLRWTGRTEDGFSSLLLHYLVGATPVLAIAAASMHRARNVCPNHALALAIPTGLLLYPGTLAHYALLLLIPLAYIWKKRLSTRGPSLAAAAVVATTFLLVELGGALVFVAITLVWAVLVSRGFFARSEGIADETAGFESMVKTT